MGCVEITHPLYIIIMCLYPRLIKNKRYMGYKTIKPKAGSATALDCEDPRKLFVAIGCGKCIECRKQKARDWQIRLTEESKVQKYKYFVTLTFSEDALKCLCQREYELKENVNVLAKRAVRLFLERWRKKYKKSVKHWLITELGHENTERIHIHGLLFTDFPITNKLLQDIWQYGMTYTGDYCNEKTINYITKYVTKVDIEHKGYEPDIMCSAGIGSNYFKIPAMLNKHKYNGKDTIQYYTFPNGQKCALPIYYRNHLFTQKQRDELWTQTLDNDRTYVRGIELRNISTEQGYSNYIRLLAEQQKDNIKMGFGDNSESWKEKNYKVTFQMLNAHAHDKTAHAHDN